MAAPAVSKFALSPLDVRAVFADCILDDPELPVYSPLTYFKPLNTLCPCHTSYVTWSPWQKGVPGKFAVHPNVTGT